jgi:16S rRNA processing protein RimM
MTKDNLLSVGKITGVHGIRGALKLYPYVESLSIFKSGHRIVLRDPDGKEESYIIQEGHPYKNILRLLLDRIDNRDAAENLIGSEIFIEKSLLPDLETNEHYWFEIIGLEVFQTDGISLGKVVSIIQTKSNDVYVVKDSDNEKLIPALQSVVVEIDLPNNRMIVDLPEGL